MPMEIYDGVVSESLHRVDNMEEKEIFRKHSWPSDDYDKAACMEELKAYWQSQE